MLGRPLTKEEVEYRVIRNALDTILTVCGGGCVAPLIDKLTGLMWSEGEAEEIKAVRPDDWT